MHEDKECFKLYFLDCHGLVISIEIYGLIMLQVYNTVEYIGGKYYL